GSGGRPLLDCCGRCPAPRSLRIFGALLPLLLPPSTRACTPELPPPSGLPFPRQELRHPLPMVSRPPGAPPLAVHRRAGSCPPPEAPPSTAERAPIPRPELRRPSLSGLPAPAPDLGRKELRRPSRSRLMSPARFFCLPGARSFPYAFCAPSDRPSMAANHLHGRDRHRPRPIRAPVDLFCPPRHGINRSMGGRRRRAGGDS
ncbi:unnamed protein product, partial [Urochloa humidicola]